jgi:aspartyl-tRNA(Asn)/glutamyl-tRNA(Gln) amidotransferase subunit B
MNSFRFIEKALEYEIKRQIKAVKDGEKIIQETRLWNTEKSITESMRSKEEAHDYRYFPDPDLMPMEFEQSWIDEIKQSVGELPDAKREKYISELNMSAQDADLLTAEKSVAEWFEQTVELGGDPKSAGNWIKGDLARLLNEENRQIDECPVTPKHLVDMLALIDKGTISGKIAKTVFEEMHKTGNDAETIVKDKGLVQVSDQSEIEKIVDDILAASPGEVERFKGGEAKLMGFFVGQVMKQTKGKANPKIVNELLRNKLS